jgi:hypothetical protein
LRTDSNAGYQIAYNDAGRKNIAGVPIKYPCFYRRWIRLHYVLMRVLWQ